MERRVCQFQTVSTKGFTPLGTAGKCMILNGGDDGTRTRGLCRDRQQRYVTD